MFVNCVRKSLSPLFNDVDIVDEECCIDVTIPDTMLSITVNVMAAKPRSIPSSTNGEALRFFIRRYNVFIFHHYNSLLRIVIMLQLDLKYDIDDH